MAFWGDGILGATWILMRFWVLPGFWGYGMLDDTWIPGLRDSGFNLDSGVTGFLVKPATTSSKGTTGSGIWGGNWILRFWSYGILGGNGILGFWDSGMMGFWGYRILGLWDPGVIRFWGHGMLDRTCND